MPEEEEVRQAMERGGYTFDPYALHSFVPVRILYRLYLRHIASIQNRMGDDGMPVNLGIRQFGAALCRTWGIDDRDIYCVRRHYHGSQLWGYIGVVGPDALHTYDAPGRPRINYDD